MNFRSIYSHGFARVATCTIPCALAQPAVNARNIADVVRRCSDQSVAVTVFPELCLSGYAIDDLLLQDVLLDAVEHALLDLARASREMLPLILVGAPLRHSSRLYNAAVVIHRGEILGVIPKTYLPNYREFYERRHFASGAGVTGETIRIGESRVPFGTDLLFAAQDVPDLVVHAEICEDLWIPSPPSVRAALAGALVLANLSASNITIGKADTRHLLCQSQSMRCMAAYLYAAAGAGESTTDLAWDGQTAIYENGALVSQSDRFPDTERIAMADVDLDLLRQERLRAGTFDDNRRALDIESRDWRRIAFTLAPPTDDIGLLREVERFPFVPSRPERLAQDCYEAYNIQVSGLVQRLRAIRVKRMVIGVSGGLDSTHALIVAVRAADRLGWSRKDVLAYTLPGFATGEYSRNNAHRLMNALGVSAHEIDIRPAARQMLADMDHPYSRGEQVYDLPFENVQAGLRTDYLFRLAGQNNGIVIGTGDLSELALGWCTYGVGDQMAHYNVNAGLPKTLIQHVIRWVISSGELSVPAGKVLTEILDQEISPELVPVADGQKPQSTQEKIGPYELQDFSLHYILRYGMRPSKIAFLAWHAWRDVGHGSWPPGFPQALRSAYTLPVIRHWLGVFLQRFFGFSQFKRSAMPNGPKVVAGGALSPRGDWRAPSDGDASAWLAELERNVPAQ